MQKIFSHLRKIFNCLYEKEEGVGVDQIHPTPPSFYHLDKISMMHRFDGSDKDTFLSVQVK